MVQAKQVHLVVLIHGLWAKEELEKEWTSRHGSAQKDTQVSGSGEDPTITTELDAGSGDIKRDDGAHVSPNEDGSEEELVVVIAGGMTSQLTYDGIDVCASRVAWEVDQQIEQLEKEDKQVTKFSVTGYSLGGLVARYLVGLLHSRTPDFFKRHQPVSFATIATPHLGIPRYNTFLSTVLIYLGSRLLSRSGEQLYVADRYSDEDPRPLLEIMADPALVFYDAVQQFQSIHIYANGVNDHTVPYPSAAIETTDHFVEWDSRGIKVQSDDSDLIESWTAPPPDQVQAKEKKGWGISMGTLPPVLRYRFPFNYLIMLLFPIMLPVVIVLMMSRLALDSRRSQKRLQLLAQTVPSSETSPLLTSASGLPVQYLRQTIRRVEREIESEMISALESPSAETHHPHMSSATQHASHKKVALSDSQLRMAMWLNKLPLKKRVSWYPDVANAHSMCIVRDPKGFPIHNRGRGLLRQWAKDLLGHDDDDH